MGWRSPWLIIGYGWKSPPMPLENAFMISEKIIRPVLDLPRIVKRGVALAVDSALCVLTIWFAYCLRLDGWVTLEGIQLLPIPVSLAIAIPIFIRMGLYRAIFRFVGWSAFVAVLKAVSLYGLLFMLIFTVYSFAGIPRTIGIMQPLLLLIGVGLSRLLTRYVLGESYRRLLRENEHPNVLIYGAGSAGRQLGGALGNSTELRVAGFLDDDRSLHGNLIGGIKVHDPKNLPRLVRELDVKTVLLAISNIDRKRRNDIIALLRDARVAVRTLPDVTALAQGKVGIADFQELEIEDLLGREAVAPDRHLLESNIHGKVVMVTGAGGSIGSELCRQIMNVGPACLLLVEQSEYGLYTIHSELVQGLEDHERLVVPLIASVRDMRRMREIMETWKPQTIYHAAAYKHVPLVEHNPAEGIRNNVFGTLSVATAAMETGVSSFVLVSTDKAVRPTNIMGASKRLAEMVLQALAEEHRQRAGLTIFSMVRFGNVLGSSGSVVPLFRQQIRHGGPITLTDPEITRFFMTIPEASQLVIQAGAMAEGGDVFVLDMGEPVKIIDLARRMVELSGLTVCDDENPEGDIAFEMIGLRPGEKLYEELLIGDNPECTSHPLIVKARDEFVAWRILKTQLDILEELMDRSDVAATRDMMAKLVSGYRPSGEIVDFVSLRQAEEPRPPQLFRVPQA